MAGPLPTIIVLAFGAALGGSDALRALLELVVVGRNPSLDVAFCVVAMGVLTAYLLGAVLLTRFLRGEAPRGAAPTDCLAQATLMVSVGVGLLVTACLAAVPLVASGGLGALWSAVSSSSAGKSPLGVAVAITVTVIAVAAAAASVRSTRAAGNNAGRLAAFATASKKAVYLAAGLSLGTACLLLVVVRFVASGGGGVDSQLLLPGVPWRGPITDNMRVSVAVATAAATTLVVVLFSRRPPRRAAAGAGAHTPANNTR